MNLVKFLFLVLVAISIAPVNSLFAQKPLNGQWQVTIRHFDYGELRTVLAFNQPAAGDFKAHSHRKGVKNMVGGFKATTASWFSSKPMLRSGALCNITDGKLLNGSELEGRMILPMGGDIQVKGALTGNRFMMTMTNAKGRNVGVVQGVRAENGQHIDDYPALVQRILAAFEERIYDKKVLQTPEWKRFAAKLKHAGKNAKDDLDIMAAFHSEVGKLPFTHCSLFRTEDENAAKSQIKQRFSPRKNQVELNEVDAETVVLKIKSFRCTAQEMDSMMQVVLSRKYQNLIVDIRGNGGGSMEGGIALAKYLTREAMPTGVYLSQKWFNQHPLPPTAAELSEMPVFTQADVEVFLNELDEKGFVVLHATPGPQLFNGKVFLLTDRRSASASEPMAWNFKASGHVTVVGEPTAGAMLSASTYPVGSGFNVVIPNADYYTPTGERLDRVGVQPHVLTSSAEALDYVLKQIKPGNQ